MAQAAAGRQPGNRFEDVGLAGAVGTDQRDRIVARGFERRRVVAAKIGQRQAVNARGGSQIKIYTRIGIRTYSAPAVPLSSISVGEPGSASFRIAVSPSIWLGDVQQVARIEPDIDRIGVVATLRVLRSRCRNPD